MHIRNAEIFGYIYITQLTLHKKTNPYEVDM